MFKEGIIDPVKVVRTALQDAASISGLLVTTEAMVADKPEEKTRHLQCQVVGWVVWVEWVVWECNPHQSQTKILKGQFLLPFFFIFIKNILIMQCGIVKIFNYFKIIF